MFEFWTLVLRISIKELYEIYTCRFLLPEEKQRTATKTSFFRIFSKEEDSSEIRQY
jgi:hypothetical protein